MSDATYRREMASVFAKRALNEAAGPAVVRSSERGGSIVRTAIQGPAGVQPRPHRGREIRHGLAGNLCRCTGYHLVVKSIQDAARRLDGNPGTS